MHVFAHNGNLQGIRGSSGSHPGAFAPLGETDSEWAFGALLDRLQPLWDSLVPPSLARRHAALAEFAAEIRRLGPANFLYADGDALFVHGDRRKQGLSGQTAAPGLWVLQKKCTARSLSQPAREQVKEAGVAVEPDEQWLTLVASLPLTDEAWIPLAEGDLLVVRKGSVISL